MPPKVTDTRSTAAESLHAVEKETAEAARKIVSSYSEDFLDAVTLSCMLGIEPEGLIYSKVAAEFEEPEEKKATKKATKKASKKASKKSSKKTTRKKATKKASKKASKKATKKSSKKTTRKKATKKASSKATKKAT
ncbi:MULTISPECIES: hypothetical protein [Corynebacterium]|uniref:hypothetical protein n=1 Tax=Corynebacterium TaxID=1716 RepID=UPI00124ED30A|nr:MULTISPECIES: hypothetical protein [Corynebacterium]MBV7281938.1 hypothetical protein [Corynebacterium sp. TAE3-ERU30]MBV7301571.1 hypothetical protein [Corynebacterium sp. TAE3-ERU2]